MDGLTLEDEDGPMGGLIEVVNCPITCELMTEPVMLVEDGQTYEKAALDAWLTDNNTSPTTGKELDSKKYVVNYTVLRTIEGLKETRDNIQKHTEETIRKATVENLGAHLSHIHSKGTLEHTAKPREQKRVESARREYTVTIDTRPFGFEYDLRTITKVPIGSPAHTAGLSAHSIILSINGKPAGDDCIPELFAKEKLPFEMTLQRSSSTAGWTAGGSDLDEKTDDGVYEHRDWYKGCFNSSDGDDIDLLLQAQGVSWLKRTAIGWFLPNYIIVVSDDYKKIYHAGQAGPIGMVSGGGVSYRSMDVPFLGASNLGQDQVHIQLEEKGLAPKNGG